jgi:hypothetical protein
MEVQRRQLRHCLVPRAFPLTVKAETDLVTPLRCLPNTDTGREIWIQPKGPDRRIQTDRLVARRESEVMTTLTEVEEIHEASKFITKTTRKATTAGPEYPTRT